MPWGKKKSNQLVPSKKNSSKYSTSTGTYAKITSKIMLVHLQAVLQLGHLKA